MKANIDKFSIAQMTSNESGKTSATGTIGSIISLVGTFCFFLGCIDRMFVTKSSDIIMQSIVVITIGVTLLGYRKSKDTKPKETTSEG